LLSLLVYGISSGSRRSVIETSELARRATSAAIGQLLRGSLDDAERVIARLAAGDSQVAEPDGALRVPRAHVPEEIARALELPALRQVGAEQEEASDRFELRGRPFLASFRALPAPEGWRVAVVVGEDELPGLSSQIRRRNLLLAFAGLLSAVILGGGLLTLRGVRRDLGRIERFASRMRNFDLSPSSTEAPFRDVGDVLQGLELAKTAMRALSRYVPVDLVRALYRIGREPQLGGELLPVTLLFSDSKGFTTLSERLPPNELAQVLGRYLEVMTAALQGRGGTIDRYIGDAIMAVWNAPTPCSDHPRRACEAALAAVAAGGEALYASSEWGPPISGADAGRRRGATRRPSPSTCGVTSARPSRGSLPSRRMAPARSWPHAAAG